MIYVIDLEPLEQRYTKQWRRWFQREWGDARFISGKVTSDRIKHGRFLDIVGTNVYKSWQVLEFCNLLESGEIRDGDKIFFMDGWHPGAIQMRYMTDLFKMQVTYHAIFHAGSYDFWDFLAQSNVVNWAYGIEDGFFSLYDNIFVATHFHKEMLERTHPKYQSKTHVTGLPFYREISEGIKPVQKENLVVFTSRLDREKNVKEFDRVASLLPNFQFVKSLEVTKTKQEYYELLNRAKVVFQPAYQETFGIGVLEGAVFNCLPVLPRRLSYQEMWPEFCYDESPEDMINAFVLDYAEVLDLKKPFLDMQVEKYSQSITRMREIMGE